MKSLVIPGQAMGFKGMWELKEIWQPLSPTQPMAREGKYLIPGHVWFSAMLRPLLACATSTGSIAWVCHSTWRILPERGAENGSVRPHLSWDCILFLLLSAPPPPLGQTLRSWDGSYSEPHFRWAREWESSGLSGSPFFLYFLFPGGSGSWDWVCPKL